MLDRPGPGVATHLASGRPGSKGGRASIDAKGFEGLDDNATRQPRLIPVPLAEAVVAPGGFGGGLGQGLGQRA